MHDVKHDLRWVDAERARHYCPTTTWSQNTLFILVHIHVSNVGPFIWRHEIREIYPPLCPWTNNSLCVRSYVMYVGQ